jgi:hypothetical protein
MRHQNDEEMCNTGKLRVNLLKYHGLRSAAFELIDNRKTGTVKHLYGKGRSVTRLWNQHVE